MLTKDLSWTNYKKKVKKRKDIQIQIQDKPIRLLPSGSTKVQVIKVTGSRSFKWSRIATMGDLHRLTVNLLSVPVTLRKRKMACLKTTYGSDSSRPWEKLSRTHGSTTCFHSHRRRTWLASKTPPAAWSKVYQMSYQASRLILQSFWWERPIHLV